jgi:hypothetical protein
MEFKRSIECIKEKAGVMKVDEIGYHSQFPCVQLYRVIIQCDAIFGQLQRHFFMSK